MTPSHYFCVEKKNNNNIVLLLLLLLLFLFGIYIGLTTLNKMVGLIF
jgi:hypothetical protein